MKGLIIYSAAGIVIGFCIGYTLPNIYYLPLRDKIKQKWTNING